MPHPNEDLLSAFDGHEVADVRVALADGADPSQPINGKLATDWLLEQYTRSDNLAECLRLILAKGAVFRDPLIAPVVLNDPAAIRAAVRANPRLLQHRTTLNSSFTSMENVSLLHVAAEYGHLEAAWTLLELGADVNARAGADDYGLNGHTPLFHTVNSHANRSAPVMKLLAEAGADTRLLLKGLHWGKGNPWHTVFFDVTPVSYAQLGLLPQMHRRETDIADNVRFLLESSGESWPTMENVPNRYLAKG